MNASHAFAGYELRFRPLMAGGRDYRFPCDALGHVDMDSLTERARLNYLYARRSVVYDNMRDLDGEFQMGKLSKEDHERLRDGLMAEAAEVVKEIDEAHIRREVEDAIEADASAQRRLK